MSGHHCCDPAHRDLDTRIRRLVERLHDAEARATWAETNEAVLADKVEELHRKIEELDG